MNKLVKISIGIVLGCVALMAIGVGALYVDITLGSKADREACPTVKPVDAANAVIHDVLRPSNQNFAKQHLSADDIIVDMKGIQIGPSAVLVPFRISTKPQRQYFGMPRCSVLSDVEYGND